MDVEANNAELNKSQALFSILRRLDLQALVQDYIMTL
jgi:hypothetical protein